MQMFQADKINAEERSERPLGRDGCVCRPRRARQGEGAPPRSSNGLLHRCWAFKQPLRSPARSLSLLRTGHSTLDVNATREFPSIGSRFRSLDQIKALIWKRARLMMQQVPTVSKGRLGQVDSKMDKHVLGEKNGRGGGLVARILSRNSQTIDI